LRDKEKRLWRVDLPHRRFWWSESARIERINATGQSLA